MKDKYITITEMGHYYGMQPFSVGKKIKCVKDNNNPYDSEAIKSENKGNRYCGICGKLSIY